MRGLQQQVGEAGGGAGAAVRAPGLGLGPLLPPAPAVLGLGLGLGEVLRLGEAVLGLGEVLRVRAPAVLRPLVDGLLVAGAPLYLEAVAGNHAAAEPRLALSTDLPRHQRILGQQLEISWTMYFLFKFRYDIFVAFCRKKYLMLFPKIF